MSALGQKQTFAPQTAMSALPPNLLQNSVAFNDGGRQCFLVVSLCRSPVRGDAVSTPLV